MNKEQEEAHAKDIVAAIAELQFVSEAMKKKFSGFMETMDRRIEDGAAVYAKLDLLNSNIEDKLRAFESKKDSHLLPKETYEDLTILMRLVTESLKSKDSKPKKTSTKPSASLLVLKELKAGLETLSSDVSAALSDKDSPITNSNPKKITLAHLVLVAISGLVVGAGVAMLAIRYVS